jgi:hypothetical protein
LRGDRWSKVIGNRLEGMLTCCKADDCMLTEGV